MLYLDTSALVKLVRPETETPALRRVLSDRPATARTSSALTRTELVRAAGRGSSADVTAAHGVLRGLHLITITSALLDHAGDLAPPGLRSLDAVHVATALELGDELEAVVTYDERMAEAARLHGLAVLAPR